MRLCRPKLLWPCVDGSAVCLDLKIIRCHMRLYGFTTARTRRRDGQPTAPAAGKNQL